MVLACDAQESQVKAARRAEDTMHGPDRWLAATIWHDVREVFTLLWRWSGSDWAIGVVSCEPL